MLQHLFSRTAAAPSAPPVTAPSARPEPEYETPLGPTVASTTEHIVTPSPLDAGGELDLPLNPPVHVQWVRPLPPSDAGDAPRRGMWMWWWAAVAVLMAFAVSYEVTRRISSRAEVTARAGERTPEPERSEETSPLPSAAVLPARPTPLETPASAGPVFSPSFAGSGSSLVFHAGRDPVARLMSAEMHESSSPLEVFTIVSDAARNYHPRLSPDGRLIAFDSDRDGERGVYVANRDGTEVRRVSGAGFAAVPSWSPDMRALAFVRAEADRPKVWNLWLLDRSTGALTPLTRHRYGQTWGASWFPNSRKICYSHEGQLIVLDIDDGSTRAFTSPRAGHLVRTPAVSPDGRVVACQVLGDGVWLLDLASGVMRRLIDDPSAEEFAWDPNGGRLAYHSRRSGEWRIWIAAAPQSLTAAYDD